MVKLAKVITGKMVVWVRNGKAMLAKSVITGKWVKLDDAQFLLDNIAALAVKAVYSGLFVDRVKGVELFDQLLTTIGKLRFEHDLGQTFTNGSPLLAAKLLTSN